jgi:hypothetical protein
MKISPMIFISSTDKVASGVAARYFIQRNIDD